MVKLGDVAEIVSGSTPKTSVPEYWDGDIPWVTPKDLSEQSTLYISTGARSITDNGRASAGLKLIPAGSVLWSSRAPIGLVAIATQPLATNQGFKNFVPGPKLNSEYLAHILNYMRAPLQSYGSGATFKEVSATRAREIEIPLPPLGEQRRIAKVLGEVDQQIESVRRKIGALESARSALFDELMKDSGTQFLQLGSLALQKPDYGIGEAAGPFEPGKGRYLRITDINSDGTLNDEVVSPKGAVEELSPTKRLEVGDIVFARSGATVGKTFLCTSEEDSHWFAGYLIRFKIDREKVDPRIVSDFCHSDSYARWIANRQQAAAQPNINARIYSRELNVPVPLKATSRIYLEKRSLIQSIIGIHKEKITLLHELKEACSLKGFAGAL